MTMVIFGMNCILNSLYHNHDNMLYEQPSNITKPNNESANYQNITLLDNEDTPMCRLLYNLNMQSYFETVLYDKIYCIMVNLAQ